MYNTEELADDKKIQLSGHILFDNSVNSSQAIRRNVPLALAHAQQVYLPPPRSVGAGKQPGGNYVAGHRSDTVTQRLLSIKGVSITLQTHNMENSHISFVVVSHSTDLLQVIQ